MIDNVELLDDSAAYDLSTSQPGASHQTSADPTAVLRKGGKGSAPDKNPPNLMPGDARVISLTWAGYAR